MEHQCCFAFLARNRQIAGANLPNGNTNLEASAAADGGVTNAGAYQPKPAPTPTDLSSLLKAPPMVTVARSLIAR